MSAYTKGPWKWEETSDGWDGKTTHFVSESVNESSADGSTTWNKCVVNGWGYDACGLDVSEADAILIAAAPELLEALKEITYNYMQHVGSEAFSVVQAARAIAKAEGK